MTSTGRSILNAAGAAPVATVAAIIATTALVVSAASILMVHLGEPRHGELGLAYACGRHDGVVFMIEGSSIPAGLQHCEKYRAMIPPALKMP